MPCTEETAMKSENRAENRAEIRSEIRSIKEIITATAAREGAGVTVHRPFPTQAVDNIDPFLLLDHMGPVSYAPGKATGFPDHPHRGFETVSYMLEGALQHQDSAGNKGVIAAGDVQWMTAGSGLVHSEMPEENFRKSGGTLNGFQLWINLPRADKMIAPRYQDTLSADIPVYESNDKTIWVKVIAGSAMGKEAVISTRIAILYLHVILQAGASFSQPIAAGQTALAYVVAGEGLFSQSLTRAGEDQLVVFNDDGEKLHLSAPPDKSVSVLLLAGEPLNEPIARYGPFVMNYAAEIREAVSDFQEGRMGQIARHQ